MSVKIFEIFLPEYQLKTKPNYSKIGKKVDKELVLNIPDGKYIYRAISSNDHKDHTIDSLTSIILESGTDKYDLNRKEVCYDDFCMYDHDIQAGFFEIKNNKLVLDNSFEYDSLFGDTVKKFYENVLEDRGYRVKIDILIIYDATKLKKAEKIDERAEDLNSVLVNCLYKFKDGKNKKDALVAIVKILS